MSTSERVTRGPVIHTEVFHRPQLTCVPADRCLRCPQEFSTYQQRILLLLPGAPRSSTLPYPLRGRLGSTRGAGGMGKWRAGSPRGWRAQHRSYALRSVARVDPVAVRTEAAPPGGEAPTPAPTARCRVAHAWGGVPRQIGTPRTPRRTGPAAPTGTHRPGPAQSPPAEGRPSRMPHARFHVKRRRPQAPPLLLLPCTIRANINSSRSMSRGPTRHRGVGAPRPAISTAASRYATAPADVGSYVSTVC